MMRLYYDDKKELEAQVRRMWREIFRDPAAYERFYFQTMYRKNRVLIFEQEKEVRGMIHLNPYQIRVNDHSFLLHYIVGVATLKQYRRQGIMRQMLIRCMKDMADAGEPFTYLMPANRLYYEPFDFVRIQQFDTQNTVGQEAACELTPLQPEDMEEAVRFVNAYCQKRFSVFTEFSADYLEQMKKEAEAEDGRILIWKTEDGIRGFCCYGRDADKLYVRQIFCEDREAMIRQMQAYLPQARLELTLCGAQDRAGASIMARILRLDLLMPVICARESGDIYLEIEDPWLEHQNGAFHIACSQHGCRLERTDAACAQKISIRDLTKILFGFDCTKQLEQYPELKQLKPLAPVMIGEII